MSRYKKREQTPSSRLVDSFLSLSLSQFYCYLYLANEGKMETNDGKIINAANKPVSRVTTDARERPREYTTRERTREKKERKKGREWERVSVILCV